MRFSVVSAFFVLAVSVMPVAAQAQTDFGGAYCTKHFACNGGASVDQVISIATNCTGPSGSTDAFDTAAGLDSNNCLTPSSSALQSSARTYQHCCVVQASANDCAVHCSFVSK